LYPSSFLKLNFQGQFYLCEFHLSRDWVKNFHGRVPQDLRAVTMKLAKEIQCAKTKEALTGISFSRLAGVLDRFGKDIP